MTGRSWHSEKQKVGTIITVLNIKCTQKFVTTMYVSYHIVS